MTEHQIINSDECKKSSTDCFLSIGCNKGDCLKNIREAVKLLHREFEIINLSSIYITSPLDIPCTNFFINCVVEIRTSSTPLNLLNKIHNIESLMGKDVLFNHNQIRPIDIDILFFGNYIINDGKLNIPHKRLHLRKFVLTPLCEIAPDFIHPVIKKRIREILAELNSNEFVYYIGNLD